MRFCALLETRFQHIPKCCLQLRVERGGFKPPSYSALRLPDGPRRTWYGLGNVQALAEIPGASEFPLAVNAQMRSNRWLEGKPIGSLYAKQNVRLRALSAA